MRLSNKFLLMICLAGGLIGMLGRNGEGQGVSPIGGTGAPVVPTMAGTGFSAFTDPQGTATLNDSLAGIILADQSNGGNNIIRTVCKSAPAVPYSAMGKIAFMPNGPQPNNSDQWVGLGWRDNGGSGVGKIEMSGLVNFGSSTTSFNGFFSNDFTNSTTWAGTTTFSSLNWFSQEAWVRLRDTGTRVQWGISPPGDGVNFANLFDQTYAASFLAISPPKICMFVNPKSNPIALTLESYKETSP